MRDLVPPFDPLAARDMPPAGETWRELVGFRGQFRGREARGPDLCSLCPAAVFILTEINAAGPGREGECGEFHASTGLQGRSLRLFLRILRIF